MNVPLLDLKAQYESIKPEIDAAIAEVIESQRFILGPQVKALEEAIAKYSGCAYGVGVSSGTDALLISLMAEGIGPGDEVITTAYSFFATAGCIARLGAKPVFVDIDPVTYNLDPTKIEKLITKNCRAILPVHLYGQMADMDPIMDIAKRHKLVVVEDGAQAIGAECATRTSSKFQVSSSTSSNQEPRTIDQELLPARRAGSIGEYGCFSFFPSKNLGAFGDGGMVVTNDQERAEKLRVLRAHGSKPKYYHKLVGGNFRLDTLQAAIVLAKLKHLDDWTAARQANAARYDKLFRDSGLVNPGVVRLPNVNPQITPITEDFLGGSEKQRQNLCKSVESVDNTPVPGARNQDPNLCKSAESVDRTPSPASVESVKSVDVPSGFRHIFNQYVVRVPRRNELQGFLKERGVGTEVYYPLPLHLQECFSYLGLKPGDLPESEKAANETLALPVFPELTDAQAQYVVDSIRTFYVH
jgi:dTDP-4-amino-4,6-dideoxygalactose transaminase